MPQVFALARSEAPNRALRLSLAACGLLPAHLPLLRLRRAYASRALYARFQQALVADFRIYVSKFAVRAAIALFPQLKTLRSGNYAVGHASAQCLASHGVQAASPLHGSGSEALLALPEWSDMHGKTVAIFCAPDGLSWLAEQLTARGAQVDNVHCYRRTVRPPSQLQAEKCAQAEIAFASSAAYLRALAPLLNRSTARQTPLLVASERIAEFARTQHFQQVFVCAGADDQAILTGISQVKW